MNFHSSDINWLLRTDLSSDSRPSTYFKQWWGPVTRNKSDSNISTLCMWALFVNTTKSMCHMYLWLFRTVMLSCDWLKQWTRMNVIGWKQLAHCGIYHILLEQFADTKHQKHILMSVFAVKSLMHLKVSANKYCLHSADWLYFNHYGLDKLDWTGDSWWSNQIWTKEKSSQGTTMHMK